MVINVRVTYYLKYFTKSSLKICLGHETFKAFLKHVLPKYLFTHLYFVEETNLTVTYSKSSHLLAAYG